RRPARRPDHRRRHPRGGRRRPRLLHRPVPDQAPRRRPRQTPPHRRRMKPLRPRFFATQDLFRAWLEKNHEAEEELLVGFYKRDSGRPSMPWPESVDQALCFGWIDGVRKSLDDEAYTIRFPPRKPTSIWSKINVDKVAKLTNLGLMRPAGERA